MAYTTVLFDLDHTIIDSHESEALSLQATLRSAEIDDGPDTVALYRAINQTLWVEVERGMRTPDDVKVLRFQRLVRALGATADPTEMAESFAKGLGSNGGFLPGARAALNAARTVATLGLITNGLSAVQRARIERLGIAGHFETVVISAEVGTAKPGAEIFELAFDQLGHPPRETTLMVGDSLTSDVQGAAAAGIASCWYNPDGNRPSSAAPQPTHEINHLDELHFLLS